MYVRAYDRAENHYFRSNVYAIVDTGAYERYLVLEKKGDQSFFELINYMVKSEEKYLVTVNINIINNDFAEMPWVEKSGQELLPLNAKLEAAEKCNSINSFRGYEFIYEREDLLIQLLQGCRVEYESSGISDIPICTRKEGWNYIESEEDIQKLMYECGGFHDSVLTSMKYISGSHRTPTGMDVSDSIRQASLIFDVGWINSVELVFEGVLSLNLRPARDNFCSWISCASVFLQDETVFFCDDDIDSEPIPDEYTWVNSLGMRWRVL